MAWGMDEDADELDEEAQDDEEMSVEEAMVAEPDDGDEEETSTDGGWGADVEDATEDDEEETNDERDETYSEQFARLVEDGVVDELTVSNLEDNYKKIEDADALEDALEQDTRSSAQEVYERRLRQLDDSDDGEVEEEEATDDEATDDDSSGWGVDDEDDDADEEEVEEIDPDELDEIGVDNLSDEPPTEDTSDEEESVTPDVSVPDDDSDGVDYIEDLGGVGASAMTGKEAADEPYLWRILAWGPPGYGKTHVGFTMPAPICIIDTEGKAHNLASKFEDKVTYIWQPEDYDEARDALFEAISVLEKYLEKGHRGTIIVDSMSEMWEWSKQKYVSKVYDGKTLDEVNLSSNMGRSGESDWKVIKRYHNKRFRQVMLDTPFHTYWTAMQTDDYERIIEGDEGNPKKPVGERDNDYKVEQVLRLVEGPKGKPVGQLQKSGSLTKHRYKGLMYPTFQKHKQVCEEIRELEDAGEDPMLAEVYDGNVSVVEGDPERYDD